MKSENTKSQNNKIMRFHGQLTWREAESFLLLLGLSEIQFNRNFGDKCGHSHIFLFLWFDYKILLFVETQAVIALQYI